MMWILLFFLFFGCSSPEQSEQDKIRRQNLKGEFIYRNHDEFYYTALLPKHRARPPYPWELKQEPASGKEKH